MRVLGMISGTSHDGIDTAVVDFALQDDRLHGVVVAVGSTPYTGALRSSLVAALPPGQLDFAEVCRLDTLVGQAFAEVAKSVQDDLDGPLDLICSHGQTMFHWVDRHRALGTLQIGQSAWIAETTGAPVLSDLRIRDIAAGGQGAPLVSGMDLLLMGDLPGHPAALNLGGIANMTVRDGENGSYAYDLGPANALIDAAMMSLYELPYDADGRRGSAGSVDTGLLAALLAEPYYRQGLPKTTGKELFHQGYLANFYARFVDADGDNLIATLTALTAQVVAAEVIAAKVDTLLVSGGGFSNPTLMGMIQDLSPAVQINSTQVLGAPPDAKEAIGFALIGWQSMHGLAGAVPGCTGASGPRILGTLTAGGGPLRLPEPLTTPPGSLKLSAGKS